MASLYCRHHLAGSQAALRACRRHAPDGTSHSPARFAWAGGLLLEIIQLQGVVLLEFATCFFAIATLLCVRFPKTMTTPTGARKGLAATRGRLRLGLPYFSTWAPGAADILRRQQPLCGHHRGAVRAASTIVRFT